MSGFLLILFSLICVSFLNTLITKQTKEFILLINIHGLPNKIIVPCCNPSLLKVFRVASNFRIKKFNHLVFCGYLVETCLALYEPSKCNNGFQVVILVSFRGSIVSHLRREILLPFRDNEMLPDYLLSFCDRNEMIFWVGYYKPNANLRL